MKQFIIFLALVSSFNLFAGNEKGNGGDAIVCRNSQGIIHKTELLDYYEGRTYRQIPHYFEKSLSHAEYFRALAKQLMSINAEEFKEFGPEAMALLQSMEEFRANVPQTRPGYIYTNSALTDIPDSQHVIVPRSCGIEQLVIQFKARFPEDPKYLIQGEILKSLSEDDFRGIVLHEVLYKLHLKHNSRLPDSIPTRYLHQIMTSGSIEEFTFRDYVEFNQTNDYISTLWVNKYDQRFYLYSYKSFDEDLFQLGSEHIHASFDQEGRIDRKHTLDNGKGYVQTGIKTQNQDCLFQTKIEILDSYENTQTDIGVGWFDFWTRFGETTIRIPVPALSKKTRQCKDATLSFVHYYKKEEKELGTFKMGKEAQVIEFKIKLGLDENLIPMVAK
ncbi:hypothetical protein ACJVC5_11620 [Peredibacter sp. HCB2-198]|uniref:hypothetical protein n=1 Tax=Peredibacter sp. HCB2-198 TaxID=3383025 RepID=UPI0038B50678